MKTTKQYRYFKLSNLYQNIRGIYILRIIKEEGKRNEYSMIFKNNIERARRDFIVELETNSKEFFLNEFDELNEDYNYFSNINKDELKNILDRN